MSNEPTQAERETAIAMYREINPDITREVIDRRLKGGIEDLSNATRWLVRLFADALARHRFASLTDAALRYLTGPCAFEEDHAREIIERVRGGEDQEETVRAILGMGR